MVASERLAEEAARMRRVPGITFLDEHDGRRAKIAGTGIDVSTVVDAWEAAGRNAGGLRDRMSMLTADQLHAALEYYSLYPHEIDARRDRANRIQEYVAAHGAPMPPFPQELRELLT